MIRFKASTEENLVREKEKMFYLTRKTRQFHMDYMTDNKSQYAHHLSPYECLASTHLPAIHQTASVAWLFQCLLGFGPSCVADLLFLRPTHLPSIRDVPPAEVFPNN